MPPKCDRLELLLAIAIWTDILILGGETHPSKWPLVSGIFHLCVDLSSLGSGGLEVSGLYVPLAAFLAPRS